MGKYLLILFSFAGLESLNNFLFKKLESGDKLFVRAIILDAVPKLHEHLTSDVGFLGDKVANDLEESVVEGQHDNAEEYLKELKEKVANMDLELSIKKIDHHHLDNLKKGILEKELDAVFINFSNNKYISDQIKEQEIRDFLEKIKIKQYSFHDGKKDKA
ncbi:hypothetical protein LJ207_10185 [Halanaerobium sp. Z-7514]|uniref:Bacterioferritin n=1 Tax=Halanaerobium polyolivorans TaxID=2886943 RepID=A0AAW4X1J3_9FIRM|nr:hypothetical protein [Halanaerobium polyolivorans]MCC3145691.1 hypothetical protein [Halanaerobium polyolivorans]RQD75075.1 MAG: hypothetical protein D5S01_05660 [Halanaerobium sp. MSAO_Bac5]